MVRKDKLISRLKTRPSDFTFEEAVTLLRNLAIISAKRVVQVDQELFLSAKNMEKSFFIGRILTAF